MFFFFFSLPYSKPIKRVLSAKTHARAPMQPLLQRVVTEAACCLSAANNPAYVLLQLLTHSLKWYLAGRVHRMIVWQHRNQNGLATQLAEYSRWWGCHHSTLFKKRKSETKHVNKRKLQFSFCLYFIQINTLCIPNSCSGLKEMCLLSLGEGPKVRVFTYQWQQRAFCWTDLMWF